MIKAEAHFELIWCRALEEPYAVMILHCQSLEHVNMCSHGGHVATINIS